MTKTASDHEYTPFMKTQPGKRSGKTRRASSLLGRAMSPALRRQGFAASEVVSRWPHIVGPVLAANCLPERLAYSAGENSDGTLHVRVAGAFAIELQHLEPLVIEKINTYYGYRAVGRLKITQGPLPARPGPRKRPASVLDPAQTTEIETAVADTHDDRLRESLTALGRAVFDRATNRSRE
ncbi:MAG: DUF721 domain-containing protein [Sphingomonadales bacterium]